jgi:hypothetical protein
MKLIIFTFIIYTIVFATCDGPLLSEKYMCEKDQALNDYYDSSNALLLLDQAQNPKNSESDRQNYLILALTLQRRYDNKCKHKSTVKPWVLNGI